MRLFRKRSKSRSQQAIWLLRLGDNIERAQHRTAQYLTRKTQYWNRSSWVVALALFILLFGGCCLLLCIKAIIHFKR